MEKQKTINEKNIPTKIEVDVCWYQDEETGEIHLDYEHMADEFELKLSELNPNIVVMCSIEEIN